MQIMIGLTIILMEGFSAKVIKAITSITMSTVTCIYLSITKDDVFFNRKKMPIHKVHNESPDTMVMITNRGVIS